MYRPSIYLLLADDDQDDCLFFKEALDELPVEVDLTVVNDGMELMQHLTGKNERLPTALFLDLNMPLKNGLECLGEMRKNEKLKNLPVVVYSTSYEPEMVNLLYKNGAHYYIRKPAEFSKLKQVIYEAIKIISNGGTTRPEKEKFILNVNQLF